MKLAYIVLAYRSPKQVVRMIRALQHPDALFLLHVDRKSATTVYETLRTELTDQNNVVFVRRHVCHWGGFGFVAAALEAVRTLVEGPLEYDYVVLLSGQDYPIKPASAIMGFFREADGRSFLDAVPLPSPRFGARGGLDRLERMHWTLTIAGRRVYVPNRYVRISLRRKLPAGFAPFGGSGYWALSRRCIEAVAATVLRRPDLIRFFRHAMIPDESFFQTVVMNSPLRETVELDSLHYIDWSEGRPSPKVLMQADLPQLRSTHKLYARKFDADVDTRVLDLIDRELLAEGR